MKRAFAFVVTLVAAITLGLGAAAQAADIDGTAGNDNGIQHPVLQGTQDSDTIRGFSGNDIALGAGDNDDLYGGTGHDELRGQTGYDDAFGGLGDDSLFGGTDSDFLNGQRGADDLRGNQGDDDLVGAQFHDYLNGGLDDDCLQPGPGSDTAHGTDGDDSFIVGRDGQTDLLNAGDGFDTVYSIGALQGGLDTLIDVEEVINVTSGYCDYGPQVTYEASVR